MAAGAEHNSAVGDGARASASWVEVGRYANGLDADLAVTLLAGQDIPAVLDNREFVGMDWMLANATGGIKVLVPPEHGIEAAKLLRLSERSRGGDVRLGEAGELEDAEVCLRCGGRMPMGDAVCDACGWTYTEELESSEALTQHEGDVSAAPEPRGLSPALRLLLLAFLLIIILALIEGSVFRFPYFPVYNERFPGWWWR